MFFVNLWIASSNCKSIFLSPHLSSYFLSLFPGLRLIRTHEQFHWCQRKDKKYRRVGGWRQVPSQCRPLGSFWCSFLLHPPTPNPLTTSGRFWRRSFLNTKPGASVHQPLQEGRPSLRRWLAEGFTRCLHIRLYIYILFLICLGETVVIFMTLETPYVSSYTQPPAFSILISAVAARVYTYRVFILCEERERILYRRRQGRRLLAHGRRLESSLRSVHSHAT